MTKIEQQQIMAKEVFSKIITKLKGVQIKPLYKDDTWPAELVEK